MKKVLLSMILAACFLWLIGAGAIGIAILIMQGQEHLQWGLPILVFIWMGVSWILHTCCLKDYEQ